MTSKWIRLAGIGLLAFLIWKSDIANLRTVLYDTDPVLLSIVIGLNVPHVLLKVVRWRSLLWNQRIIYSFPQASLAHFSSLFIGFISPGRVGDFARVLHIIRDCGASVAKAFSTVLVDRLFDIYAVLLIGGVAFAFLRGDNQAVTVIQIIAIGIIFLSPLIFVVNTAAFTLLQRFTLKLGKWTERLIGPGQWLTRLRDNLRAFTINVLLLGLFLTVISYALFLGQSILLAESLDLNSSFAEISFAVAMGSLAALIPISVSGLGTREAVIVTYLATTGVSSEHALAFSLLLFLNFYVVIGLMGALAWFIKPMPLKDLRSIKLNNVQN